MPESIADPIHTLRTVFGYDGFRGQQQQVIDTVLAGGDALVLMPTGGGKSLCYQIPSLLRDGVGIVVSPLIALMQDQVQALRQLGVRAAALNSSLSYQEGGALQAQLAAGEIDILYVAPERLMMEQTLAWLARTQVALFAIDEAHCVSQWGHAFRPEYMQLSVLHERFPHVPRIALTATADQLTIDEMVVRLHLEDAQQFIAGFDRPNIRYTITEKSNPKAQLLGFINREHADDAGIVYCLSRRKTDDIAAWLCQQGKRALPYHAGMTQGDRQRNQSRFIREDGIIIVATVAFGMGIDKPDVRFVAHLDLPSTIEAYYQETGRAGRDGAPADAWMAYGLQDVIMRRQMVEQSDADDARKQVERRKLDAMLALCEVIGCRRQQMLAYFGDQLDHACGNCDTCLTPPQTWDASEAVQKALSCIYRTGQRFGVNHLIDVLLGKENERIGQLGHDRVSTFGIGRELSATQWRALFRQIVARGLVMVDDEYGGLKLNANSRPVLMGEQTVTLRQAVKKERVSSSRAAKRSGVVEWQRPEDVALWEALRQCRKQLSEEQGVPSYVVFHDATLRQMVEMRPQDLIAFAAISGVGEQKLDRYGAAFLQVIVGAL
ncbi:MAG: DNA helicase RecQ [Mariprofundales bacterium]|nr:DNA helicase RecQ [Mariprofundales bacterium]